MTETNGDARCWSVPVDGNPKWSNWPMAGVWLCRHLWDHFAFTGDREYLREAWPVLRAPRIGSRRQLQEWLDDLPEAEPHHRHHGGGSLRRASGRGVARSRYSVQLEDRRM